jgi:hypothetical protein
LVTSGRTATGLADSAAPRHSAEISAREYVLTKNQRVIRDIGLNLILGFVLAAMAAPFVIDGVGAIGK